MKNDKAFSFKEVLKCELQEIDLAREARKPSGQEGRLGSEDRRKAGGESASQSQPAGDKSPGESQQTKKETVYDKAHGKQLVGLAFSGGGIRSATFNLGVLQALAEVGLLPLFDYLSTVSGGGYIGSWLTAWIKHEGNLASVQTGLAPQPTSGTPADEPRQIKFLRSYSNYLMLRLGLLSADTWTFVSTYLRNLLLNLLILIAALAGVLLFPRLVVWAVAWLGRLSYSQQAGQQIGELVITLPVSLAWLGLALLCLALAVYSIIRNLTFLASEERMYPKFTCQGVIQKRIVVPVFVAAWFGSCWLWFSSAARGWEWWHWALGAAPVYLLPWLLGLLSRRDKERLTWAFWALFAGAVGGLLLWALAQLIHSWAGDLSEHWKVASWGTPLMILIFTLTAVLHIGLIGRRLPDDKREWWGRLGGWLCIYALVWVGLFGVAIYSPLGLIWAGRWIGATLSVGWMASTIAGVLAGKSSSTGSQGANPWLELVGKIAPFVFVVGLLVALSLGIYATLPHMKGYSPPEPVAESSRERNVPFEIQATIGNRSVSVEGSLEQERDPYRTLADRYWLQMNGTVNGWLWLWFVVIVGVALSLSWRVDINEFSMHSLYRNRLTRAYLGASNPKRRPHPFTGFDPLDDFRLSELAPAPDDGGSAPQIPSTPDAQGSTQTSVTSEQSRAESSYQQKETSRYPGPYPIINTTLNLVGGEELAWQERKSTSFVFTPLFSGYEVPPPPPVTDECGGTPDLQPNGYRRTEEYAYPGGGIKIGTTVGISGAAASPNMGYHSSPALAFLMTVFNVRLGWWLGNPRTPAWTKSGPGLGLVYLLRELFGYSDDRSSFIYLSDGGHFENLGLYELIRRRCRYIVACDGSQDAELTFENLGNAIRKCRTDMGVEIEIDVNPIRRQGEKNISPRHCAVGLIRYDKVDEGATPGILVYLKPSLTGDEPTDVLNYSSQHSEFPHQTTADQFFDESQFESYRKLGYHVAKTAFEAAAQPGGLEKEVLFVALRQAWYPPSLAVQTSFTKHSQALEEIFSRIRQDKKLKFLEAQIYPEWQKLTQGVNPPNAQLWLPQSYDEVRAGFYICNSLIQLMENVYLDLNLEQEHDHPDNRGWMNLFKHWSWSGMFRLTWTVCASTYGARFQTFCERRLDLTLGKIEVNELGKEVEKSDRDKWFQTVCGQAKTNYDLNFLELRMINYFWTTGGGIYRDDLERIFVLQVAVADPMGLATSMSFTFGFALVDQNKNIWYFRIQDHVRTMGLGLKALEALDRTLDYQSATRQVVKADDPYAPNKADRDQFEKHFRSVRYRRPLQR